MDVAALRRLQHRMEARGRAAYSCTVNCGLGRPHCSCVLLQEHKEAAGVLADVGDTTGSGNKDGSASVSSAAILSDTARSWLIQRLEETEVDITGGAAEHQRDIPCCCSCCQGYHHSYHVSRDGSGVQADHLNSVSPNKSEERNASHVSEPRADRICWLADGTCSSANGRSDPAVPALRAYDVPAVRGVPTVFKPAKSSKFLSAILRNAELISTSLRPPEGKGTPESDPDLPTPRMSQTLESAARIFKERKRTFAELKTPSTSEFTHASIARAHSPSLVTTDRRGGSTGETTAEGDSQPPSVNYYSYFSGDASLPRNGSIQKDTLAGTLVAGSITEQPVHCVPVAGPAVSQRSQPLSVAVQTENGVGGPCAFPDRRLGSPEPEEQLKETQFGGSSCIGQSADATSLMSQPAELKSRSQGSVKRHAAATKPTVLATEPSPTEVINALREKLLLEKADAYVRLLEQQVSGGLHTTKSKVEEEEACVRSHTQERILSLLARLHQEDQEIMEAFYDTVGERDIVEQPHGHVASPLLPASTSSPPSAQRLGGDSVTSVRKPENPICGRIFFPEEVMAAYEQCSVEVPPARKFVAGEASLTSAECQSADVPRGSMKAWVDRHFSDSLDPQHRALLHHVLLSREAEVRRAEAAESQCRSLRSQIGAGDAVQSTAAGRYGRSDGQQSALPTASGTNEGGPRVHGPDLHGTMSKSGEAGCSMPSAALRTEDVTGHNNERAPDAPSLNAPGVLASMAMAASEDELQRWKNRCDAIERQHRISVQRLGELQTYIDQLRRDAHQAVVQVAAAGSTTVPAAPSSSSAVHQQMNEPSFQTSSVRDARTSGFTPTTGVSDTPAFTQPPPSTCQPYSTIVPAVTGDKRSQHGADTGSFGSDTTTVTRTALNTTSSYVTPITTVGPAPSDAAPPTTDREAVLQKLREELDAECSRFVDGSRRWQQFVEGRGIALPHGGGR